jgi:hypothetical protein
MNDNTIYFIISSVSAICGALIKLLYDSKCSHISILYGCVDVDRNIMVEQQIEEHKHDIENK